MSPRSGFPPVGVAAAIAVAAMLSGCATYQAEKADLMRGGGESYRLQQARERLENEQARQLGLREDQASAEEELAAIQGELRAVNSNRSRMQTMLASATSSGASPEQTARLRRQLNSQTDEFNDTVLEIEAARSRGATAEVRQKRQELARLRQELEATNREIEILSQ